MSGRAIFKFDRHCFQCCKLVSCRDEKFYWTINQKRAGLFRITGCFMVITKTPGFSECRNCHHSGSRDQEDWYYPGGSFLVINPFRSFAPVFTSRHKHLDKPKCTEQCLSFLQHCGGCVVCYGLFSVWKQTVILSLRDGILDHLIECLRAF